MLGRENDGKSMGKRWEIYGETMGMGQVTYEILATGGMNIHIINYDLGYQMCPRVLTYRQKKNPPKNVGKDWAISPRKMVNVSSGDVTMNKRAEVLLSLVDHQKQMVPFPIPSRKYIGKWSLP